MKFFNWSSRVFMYLVCAVIVACSIVALMPRLELERENRNVAIIVDYRDVIPLAEEAGISNVEAMIYLREKGVTGVMVSEFIDDDVEYAIPPGFTGPDWDGLKDGAASGLNIFYRMAPAQTWQFREFMETTRQILTDYPQIVLAAPSGDAAIGYPDMRPLASLLREHSVSVAQVEFSRQLGATQLNWMMYPNIIPLHSVTNRELVARRISRQTLHERLVRAAIERSVRILILRPAFSGYVESSLSSFGQEVESLASTLESHGLKVDWPKSLFGEYSLDGRTQETRTPWRMNFISALACSLVFVLSLTRYVKRLNGLEKNPVHITEAALTVLGACAIALAAWRIPEAARQLGAFSAVFIVTEVSLIALDDVKYRSLALLESILFALVGGLAISALFSQPAYMFRLTSFSGVRLTLALPPLLVVLHDLRRRIHPESLTDLLSRPPVWGELALGAALLALIGLILFRSDNVQFIPGIEARLRHSLEQLLVARPRTREVFIGYPSILLYYFAVKMGLWARYRELLRIGVVLGFASVINSFCHYHTPLMFILLRQFNGLWVGLMFGVLAVAALKYIGLPLWQRVRFITE